MNWSISEWLFYGGIAGMAATVLLSVVVVAVLWISGRKLQEKFQQEYGEKRH